MQFICSILSQIGNCPEMPPTFRCYEDRNENEDEHEHAIASPFDETIHKMETAIPAVASCAFMCFIFISIPSSDRECHPHIVQGEVEMANSPLLAPLGFSFSYDHLSTKENDNHLHHPEREGIPSSSGSCQGRQCAEIHCQESQILKPRALVNKFRCQTSNTTSGANRNTEPILPYGKTC
jgi:hypothetical protein